MFFTLSRSLGILLGERGKGGGQRKDKRISILIADNGIFFSSAHDVITFVKPKWFH